MVGDAVVVTPCVASGVPTTGGATVVVAAFADEAGVVAVSVEPNVKI